MNAKHSNASVEHYTPPEIVEAARMTMIRIDLDPASCVDANRHIVKAKRYFDAEQNGFRRKWSGRVLLNPPGGLCDADGTTLPPRQKGAKQPAGTYAGAQSSAAAWHDRLVEHYEAGSVKQAVFVGFTIELLQTTQAEGRAPILEASALCFPSERICFLHRNAGGVLVAQKSPTHANVIAYYGPRVGSFRLFFSAFGKVVQP